MNSARYFAMIREFLVSALHRRRLSRFRIWFQQDGATAHTSREAMAELRRLIPGKLLSHRGDVPWPAFSPDLSTCDFFCGDTSKDKCTSTSHKIFLSWRMQLRWNCAPYLAESVHLLLSEAERVRQKPGSSFKRRYFSYLSMFWNIRMVFLHCNITCVY